MADKLAQAEAKKAEGNAAFAKKEYATAIDFYSEAIALDASNHLYYSNRSICYAETGKLGEAKMDGEMCMKLDPSFVKGYHRKANAEFLMGELDLAEVTIREGLKKDAAFSELTKLRRKIKASREKAASAARRSAAGPAADQGLRNELKELGEQYHDTNTELLEVKAKLESSARECRRHDLTKDEVAELPGETPLFRSVGKMFLRSEPSDVKDFIDQQLASEEKKKVDLLARQTYLERRLHSQEANLKDLMSSLMSTQPEEGAPHGGSAALAAGGP